jgi:hypothetical protein
MSAALAAFAGHRYEIEVTAEPASDKVAGTVRLNYRNHTGRVLTEVPLRGIAMVTRVLDKNRQELSRTTSSVRLRTPLQPGEEAVLVIELVALAAFQKHFGMDPSALETEWRASLALSDVQPVPEEILQRIKEESRAGRN